MILTALELVFAVLNSLKLNLQVVSEIIAGGKEAFDQVKAALANQEDPTLEQIKAKWDELRPPVDLTPEDDEQ